MKYLMDILHAGGTNERTDRHVLAGVVTVDGVPASRSVVVLDRATATYKASTMSNQTSGEWKITNLPQYPERSLLVLALDNTSNYNAEVADYISQVTG